MARRVAGAVDRRLILGAFELAWGMDIYFSPSALAWLQRQRPDGSCLLIGLKKSGCAGFEHRMTWIQSPTGNRMDSNASFDVYALPQDQGVLKGLEIDLVTRGLNQEIAWRNPNAEAGCGCGISWTFPERALPTLG